jgi:alpha-glucosidase
MASRTLTLVIAAGLGVSLAACGDSDPGTPDQPDGVLAFTRGPGFTCVVNLSSSVVPLPPGEVLLASGPLSEEGLPPDTAVWLHQATTPLSS